MTNPNDTVRPVALRPERAFDALDIGRTRGFEELKSGRLRSVRVGRMRLVPVSALTEWLADREAEQTAGDAA